MNKLTSVVTGSLKKQTCGGVVIFLHGSGDTGQGCHDWVKSLHDWQLPSFTFIYPTAPFRPYTAAHGELRNVWFDRHRVAPHAKEHKETTNESAEAVADLIDEQIKNGIPPSKIVLGGFSMGGGLALHVGLRYKPEIAGVFALSSFLNNESFVYDKLKENPTMIKPPVFMCHGPKDPVVDYDWGENTYKNLLKFNVKAEFYKYPNIYHEMSSKELQHLDEWIQQIVINK